ncbi:MAG: nucleotide exchange factor GrpE [Planctomycetota bacterium]|jgi:molecular chaperone GrpE
MSEKDIKKANKEIKLLEKKVEELENELKEVAAEKQDTFEQLQRVSADYANYQKRAPKQIADSVAYEKKVILKSLLPSIDNFEHALAHASEAQGEDALDNIVKGIQLVFDHMLDALKSHGVKRIDALGQPFDPNLHEAMMRQSNPDKDDDSVLEVYQAGYLMGEQVLRPSKVIVNKIEEEKPAEEAPETGDENNETEQES